jgi:hypothetical protein
MNRLAKHSFKAATLARFISRCAEEAQAQYFLTGACALLARNVIERTTNVQLFSFDLHHNLTPFCFHLCLVGRRFLYRTRYHDFVPKCGRAQAHD